MIAALLATLAAAAPTPSAPALPVPPAASTPVPVLEDWEVDQIGVANLDADLVRTLQPLHTMAAVEKALRRKGIKFERRSQTMDPDALPIELVRRVNTLPAGEPWVIPGSSGSATINHVVTRRRLPVDPRATAAFDRLLTANRSTDNSEALAQQFLDSLLPNLMRGNSGNEQRVRTILRDEILALNRGMRPEIEAKQRRIYLRTFSVADLEEMVRQAESPLGRKLATAMPRVQAEMFRFTKEAGAAAMQAAMPRIIQRMRAANLAVPSTI